MDQNSSMPESEDRQDQQERAKLQADSPTHQPLRAIAVGAAQQIDEAEQNDAGYDRDRAADQEIGWVRHLRPASPPTILRFHD
jgi:hypothetical protein